MRSKEALGDAEAWEVNECGVQVLLVTTAVGDILAWTECGGLEVLVIVSEDALVENGDGA